MDIERDFGVAVPSTIGQLMNFPRRERANRDTHEHAPVYTEVRFHLAILTGVWLPCHPSIRPSVRPAVRPPTSLVLVIPSISTIAEAVGEGTRGECNRCQPPWSVHQGSTGVVLPWAPGPRKLFIAGSQRVRSERSGTKASNQRE